VEAMMHPDEDFLSAPELDYDGFRAAMREDWGWFTPARETNIFASKVRTRRVLGFGAVDLTSLRHRAKPKGFTKRSDQRARGLMSRLVQQPTRCARQQLLLKWRLVFTAAWMT
jgi:hypothetical protein